MDRCWRNRDFIVLSCFLCCATFHLTDSSRVVRPLVSALPKHSCCSLQAAARAIPRSIVSVCTLWVSRPRVASANCTGTWYTALFLSLLYGLFFMFLCGCVSVCVCFEGVGPRSYFAVGRTSLCSPFVCSHKTFLLLLCVSDSSRRFWSLFCAIVFVLFFDC